MDLKQIDSALTQTLEDHKLSRSERKALSQVLADLGGDEDTLRYVRNQAFEMAKGEMETRDAAMVLEWVEGVVRAIDGQRKDEPESAAQVQFSPGDECRNQVTSLCQAASRTIDVCVYTITDNRIKRALLDAHRRGIKLRVITDDEKIDDLGSDIYELRDEGIDVVIDRGPEFMHHKFAIFDRSILLNGSFNWTRGASEQNHENVIVTDDRRLVGQFQEKFEELWAGLLRL